MCLVLCLFSVIVVIIDIRSRRKARDNSHKIFIASATFDKKGNLLVKADGMLPIQVIETSALSEVNTSASREDEELSVSRVCVRISCPSFKTDNRPSNGCTRLAGIGVLLSR